MAETQQNRPRVLVVDDEESIRHMLCLSLQREGFPVRAASDAASALEVVESYGPLIVLCDIRMPGEMDGLGLLEVLKARGSVYVVMMSAYGSRETALEAVRRGAYDYIEKPIQRDELFFMLEKLMERERLHSENQRLREELRRGGQGEEMVADAPSIKRVIEVARKVAGFPSTVLLQGESGTGKEVLARAIHDWSDRREGAWTVVNCGSIPEALLESELFGHKKGSFTGAGHDREGLFEASDGGSLFLDEIGEMPQALQVKLLRTLQDKAIRRLGETSLRQVDVRVIAATNRDLAEEVKQGRFREDLFYRLNVIRLELPPLRERLEDIPLLVEHFLAHFNARFGTEIASVDPRALKTLVSLPWPGNIRQLRNTIERAMVLAEGVTLLPKHFSSVVEEDERQVAPEVVREGDFSLKKAMRRLEEVYIRRALEETGGNRSAAARLLEISPRALLYKIKDYELAD